MAGNYGNQKPWMSLVQKIMYVQEITIRVSKNNPSNEEHHDSRRNPPGVYNSYVALTSVTEEEVITSYE